MAKIQHDIITSRTTHVVTRWIRSLLVAFVTTSVLYYALFSTSTSNLTKDLQNTQYYYHQQIDDVCSRLHIDTETLEPTFMEPNVRAAFAEGAKENQCMHFDCDWDLDRCTIEAHFSFSQHNDKKPCCIDILRYLHKTFSEEMCDIGLGGQPGYYTAIYGSLLGLIRHNDIIPWSNDNDYLVHEVTMEAMTKYWNETRSGISLVYAQNLYRMCINSNFIGGQLQKWQLKKGGPRLDKRGYPYIDLYVGAKRYPPNSNNNSLNSSALFAFQVDCCLKYDDIWPTNRMVIDNGEYEINVPGRATKVLNDLYGTDWKTPDSRKRRHGGNAGVCHNARCPARGIDKVHRWTLPVEAENS